MQTLKENIIEILLKSGLLSKEKLEQALEIQKAKHLPLRKVLIENKFISEEVLLSLLSGQLYIPSLHLQKYKFDTDIIKLIPERMAKQYNIIPISRLGDTITVAMSDPLNIFALDDLKSFTGDNINTVLSSESEISKAIEAQYHVEVKNIQELLQEESTTVGAVGKESMESFNAEAIELTSALKDSEKAPIIKLINLILNEALKKRASDIHVEPEFDFLRIRFRVDGALHEVFKIPKANQNAVLARFKIISNLDITENRIPQDGRFKVKFENREVDFRVSALPTSFGQKFVMRLLDRNSLSVGLDKLGFSEQPAAVFKEAITKPFGMLLVTGPTGSGKSTTLYSILNQINVPERNIITIEDPVEYQIEGITQLQVKPEIGLDFASGLRSLLRQSPDVIMIGEIRDSETADIAVKAALTGQLVLSTLHTNDAISSITRIIDMGVEPFLVASSIVMLCAQRLCRKLCLKCRQTVDVPKDLLDKIGFNIKTSENIVFYKAVGCKYCNNTGFYGRIAILEAILIDDIIREMVIKRKSLDEIKQYVIEKRGMMTLRDDAFIKAREGIIALDEAIRVTTEE